MKKAYPGAVPPDVTIWRWYQDFKKGQKSRELKPRDGSEKSVCTNININTGATVIEDNHHLSIRAIADWLPNDSECEDDIL